MAKFDMPCDMGRHALDGQDMVIVCDSTSGRNHFGVNRSTGAQAQAPHGGGGGEPLGDGFARRRRGGYKALSRAVPAAYSLWTARGNSLNQPDASVRGISLCWFFAVTWRWTVTSRLIWPDGPTMFANWPHSSTSPAIIPRPQASSAGAGALRLWPTSRLAQMPLLTPGAGAHSRPFRLGISSGLGFGSHRNATYFRWCRLLPPLISSTLPSRNDRSHSSVLSGLPHIGHPTRR